MHTLSVDVFSAGISQHVSVAPINITVTVAICRQTEDLSVCVMWTVVTSRRMSVAVL
jgi:hypothetical protein